jgi:hypothetical protein
MECSHPFAPTFAAFKPFTSTSRGAKGDLLVKRFLRWPAAGIVICQSYHTWNATYVTPAIDIVFHQCNQKEYGERHPELPFFPEM